MPSTSGLAPFGVFTTLSVSPSSASQAQPLPNWVTAAVLNWSLKASRVAERVVDPPRQLAARRAAAAALHHPPEQHVVPVLAGVVEDARPWPGPWRTPRTISSSERILQIGVLDQIVEVGDVGLVMLVVVQVQGPRRHVGLERIVGVGQVGEFESHGCPRLAQCVRAVLDVPLQERFRCLARYVIGSSNANGDAGPQFRDRARRQAAHV